MTSQRHGSAGIEFPSELSILITREFEAPIDLVFDVFTKPEHVRNHFAPFDDEMTVCDIDLRVGGSYHFVTVTKGGIECSFRGTYLEIEPPTRSVQTWIFDGWPDAEAVETIDLSETDGVTTLTLLLVFGDQAGRDHMTKYDGMQASFDNAEAYLRSLRERDRAASG